MCGRRLAGFISLRVQQLDVRCETKTKVSYNVHAVQHCVHCVLVFVCTHMIYVSIAACCRCVVELFFWPKLFSVARFPLIFSGVDDAFARQSFLLCDASVSWINEFMQKERKKEEENRSKIVNDKSRVLVRTQITSSKMRLCTWRCLRIEFFSEKESAVSIASRNRNLLAAPCILITTHCPLKCCEVRLCTSKCLGVKFFSEKESAVSKESGNIHLLPVCCILITTDCPLKVCQSASVHLGVSWNRVFLWKRVRCIERTSQYTSLGCFLCLYDNRLPSEKW